MPPGRGGRGGRVGRGRPPPSVRNAMAELGKGSLATYEQLVQNAARSNVDAARGYFPELESEKKARPKKLVESEIHIVKLYDELRACMKASPHYVETADRMSVSGWVGDLQSIENYYFSTANNNSDNMTNGKNWTASKNKSSNSTEQSTSSTLSSSSSSRASNHSQDRLWQVSKGWYISELIPMELIPRKLRRVKRILGQTTMTKAGGRKHVNKKHKPNPAAGEDGGESSLGYQLNMEASRLDSGEAEGGEEEDREEEDADANDLDAAALAANEEDDDLELDADYQTGIKFDDDEGYEENDSGAEEATF